MFFLTFTYSWKTIFITPLTSTLKYSLKLIDYWNFTEFLMFLPLRLIEN